MLSGGYQNSSSSSLAPLGMREGCLFSWIKQPPPSGVNYCRPASVFSSYIYSFLLASGTTTRRKAKSRAYHHHSWSQWDFPTAAAPTTKCSLPTCTTAARAWRKRRREKRSNYSCCCCKRVPRRYLPLRTHESSRIFQAEIFKKEESRVSFGCCANKTLRRRRQL